MTDGGDAVGVSELVRGELERHDWAALRCGCGGSAEHVPLMFEVILTAQAAPEMIGFTLDEHVESNCNLFECAVPTVGVILAALAGDLPPLARSLLMITLWRLVGGDSHSTEVALGRTDLGEECGARAREGFWVIIQAGLTGSADDADTAADICELLDLDEQRSAFYQARLRERVSAKTKRGRSH